MAVVRTEAIQVGIDIGQKVDPTAIVVCEVQRRGHKLRRRTRYGKPYPKGGEFHYVARHVERLPLGTLYPQVTDRLMEIDTKLQAEGHKPRYWADATGVGKPVVDMLRKAGLRRLIAVYFTGSDKATRDDDGNLNLGKAAMVSRLQVLLQSGRIDLPADDPEAAALIKELLNYEIKITDDAHDTYGAFKVGTHDDLATALGLACWQEPRGKSRYHGTM